MASSNQPSDQPVTHSTDQPTTADLPEQDVLAIARQHYQRQQFSIAERLCRNLIEQNPDHLDGGMLLGMALHRQSRLDEATHAYQRVIDRYPDHAPAYNNLAVIFKHQGRYDEAIRTFEQAIALNPQSPEAYNNLGNLLRSQGQLQAAQHRYQQAVERAPNDPDVRLNLGNVLRDQGQLREAIAHYQAIIEQHPTFANAYNNLGNLLQSVQHYEVAIACYQAGLHHRPTPNLYNNLGAALQETGRDDEAIAAYQHALALHPTYADAYYNLGNALRTADRLDEAIVAYRKAIAFDPTIPKPYNNLGLVLHDLGDLKGAIAAYQHALELDPEDSDAHLNLGLSWLMQGDLARGFAEYEWRWRVKGRDFKPPRDFSQPPWNGADLHGQTLLLYAEQGLGDTLQFIRYAPLVAQRGGRVWVECQEPLVSLLETMPAITQVIPQGADLPPFDTHAPLMSLPYILGTTLATLPAQTPYLTAPSSPSPLPPTSPPSPSPLSPPSPLRIGITWAGSPTHKNDRHRSCPFQQMVRLRQIPGVQLYSLQKGEREKDLDERVEDERLTGDNVSIDSSGQSAERPFPIINLASQLNSFADTAAAIAHLDLVITVDTSVAHLAGALGKPVWVLLGVAYDWRWLRDRTDSPWYPTARLFHQRQPGDWGSVFEAVTQALHAYQAGDMLLIPPPTAVPGTEPLPDAASLEQTEALQRLQSLIREQRWTDAEPLCQSVLAEHPDSYQGQALLGQIAYAQRHYEEAIAQLAPLCTRYATDPKLWSQLGNAYLHTRQYEAALRWYRAYLVEMPNSTQIRTNLGVALRGLGRDAEAIAHYQLILKDQLQSVDTHYNLANVLRDQERFGEAAHHYRQAIALQPDYAHAWNNLANVLKDQNQLDEAIACYEKTLELVPDHASAHHNLGYALLLRGDLARGLAEYEWRWRVANFKAPPTFSQPQWDGADLQGQTILLHTEQGFGDTLQFIRYAPLVAERGGRVLVECRPPLVRLLETIAAIAQVIPRGTPLPPFDTHAPLMSLPYILGLTPLTHPTPSPYLPSPTSLTPLPPLPPPSPPPSPSPLRIGITWAGSPTHQNDHNRSCPFAYFWSLLRTPSTQFYSLQKGERTVDLAAYCDDQWPIEDLSDRLHDFADTAEAIAQLDLVITVDTSVAHLAGALGKSVWIVLSHAPDWRWMLDRDDSPWYPTVRLFRQPKPGDWASVFAHIRSALVDLIQDSFRDGDSFGGGDSSRRGGSRTAPTPASQPQPAPTPIGLGIELSTSTGWGVFGMNLALQLLKTRQWHPVPLLPPLAGTQFNPLHEELLQPILADPIRIERLLTDHPQQTIKLPFTVLKALGNHFVTTPQLQRLVGTQTVGLIFFEDAQITAQDVEVAKSYDLIVTGSRWNEEVLRSHSINSVTTVCQGIDPTIFHPAPRSGLFGDRFVIFSGGKLEYRKGQDIVVQAFRLFQQHHPDALLLTAWHNIWPDTLKGIQRAGYVHGIPQVGPSGRLQIKPWLVKNGLPESACLDLGVIPNPLMGQIVREADVALFPNRCEGGTNLAAMECLACGVPTILSANTGHLDLIRDGLGYPLMHQSPIQASQNAAATEGWGESDIDEILTLLEMQYENREHGSRQKVAPTDPSTGQAKALPKPLADAQLMQNWSWEQQVVRLLQALNQKGDDSPHRTTH